MVDNYNNYNEKEIKIIDKYKTNNNFIYDSNTCLRQINEPIKFEKNNNYLSGLCYKINNIDKENKILEKVFMIYELYDDFDKFNLNILLNLLSYTNFKIDKLSSSNLNINLSDAYFFCDNNGDDIIYINQEELKYQISIGEININEHKYCDMFGYLLEKNKYSNKLLIIPLCTNILMNYLPLMLSKYNIDLIYTSKTNKIFKFIKNIYCSTQTITLNKDVKFRLLVLSILINDNFQCKIPKGYDMSIYSYLPSNPDLTKYIIMTLSPNYEEIDSCLWNDAINLLPKINYVSYVVLYKDCESEKYNIEEIAVIKKSPNSHIYCLPANPNYSIKKMIEFGDDTDNFLDIINTDIFYTEIRSRKTCNSEFIFNIDTPKIPIIININNYFHGIIISE